VCRGRRSDCSAAAGWRSGAVEKQTKQAQPDQINWGTSEPPTFLCRLLHVPDVVRDKVDNRRHFGSRDLLQDHPVILHLAEIGLCVTAVSPKQTSRRTPFNILSATRVGILRIVSSFHLSVTAGVYFQTLQV
jgi:hypothetical protein